MDTVVRRIVRLMVILFFTVLARDSSGFDTLSRRVVALDEHGGQVTVRGAGQASHYVIRYEFDGFYVWAVPAASDFVARASQVPSVPAEPALLDVYYVIPQKTTLTIDGSVHGVDCSEGRRTGSDSFVDRRGRFFYRDVIEIPDLTKTDARASVPMLMGRIVTLNVSDQRPLGGDLTWNFLGNTTGWKLGMQHLGKRVVVWDVGDDGAITTGFGRGREDWMTVFQQAVDTRVHYYSDGVLKQRRQDQLPLGWTVKLGCNPIVGSSTTNASRLDLSSGAFQLRHELDASLKLPDDADVMQLQWSGHQSYNVPTDNDTNTIIGGDAKYIVSVEYNIGLKQEVDATLEAVAADEANFLPDPTAEEREYILEFHEPRHEEIEDVRVYLTETSQHSGIATNAGNHALCAKGGSCRDCKDGCRPGSEEIETKFGGVSFVRYYPTYDECPVDQLPDAFLREDLNEGFQVESGASYEGLHYRAAQSLTLKEPPQQDRYTLKVTLRDGAASTQLRAEVKIGGQWYAVTAKGATANSDQEYLAIPRDENHNGMADAFGGDRLDKTADDEAIPNPTMPGDGLTVFEEYRSVFSRGEFLTQRLDPLRMEVYVHDYSHRYDGELEEIRQRYDAQGLKLVQLKDCELKHELVNWQVTEHRGGGQFVIVLMESGENQMKQVLADADIAWERIGGIANREAPPRQFTNTAIIDREQNATATKLLEAFGKAHLPSDQVIGTIAHELGHVMGIRHHGDTDFWAQVDGEERAVATPNGQRSGDTSCFMRYRGADKFFEYEGSFPNTAQFLAEQGWTDLPDYPAEDGAQIGHRYCTGPAGTGINVDGQWSGDAKVGGCLYQINLRSW